MSLDLADLLRRAKAFVFDFDGTLVHSEEIKSQAFKLCFADYPDRLDNIMAYCRGHNHNMRCEKFHYICQEILRLDYTADVAAMLQDRFASATTRQIIEAPEVRGASGFLALSVSYRMNALLSGTPHEALIHILVERGWRKYFNEIRGAPVDKGRWLLAFRERYGLAESETVFFGDTIEDAEAAKNAGCAFIAVGEKALARKVQYFIKDFQRVLKT